MHSVPNTGGVGGGVSVDACGNPATSSATDTADMTVRISRMGGVPGPSVMRTVRIVHVSDTHDKTYQLPDGDILVHSGDMTEAASPDELERFRDFLRMMPHRHKVIVCGSHEAGLDRIKPVEIASKLTGGIPGCQVLHDAEAVIEGIKFYGSPWNNGAKAFAMSPEACEIKFQRVPADTEVLVTHQPPFGILDISYPPGQYAAPDETTQCADCGGQGHPGGKHWGSVPLRKRVEALRLPLHLFGRSHHSAGVQCVSDTVYSNGAMEVKGRAAVIDVAVEEPAATSGSGGQQHHQPYAGRSPVPTSASFGTGMPQQLPSQGPPFGVQQHHHHQPVAMLPVAQPGTVPLVATPPGSSPGSFPPTPQGVQQPPPWAAAMDPAQQAAMHQQQMAQQQNHQQLQQQQQQQHQEQQAWQHFQAAQFHQAVAQQQHNQQQHAAAAMYQHQQHQQHQQQQAYNFQMANYAHQQAQQMQQQQHAYAQQQHQQQQQQQYPQGQQVAYGTAPGGGAPHGGFATHMGHPGGNHHHHHHQ